MQHMMQQITTITPITSITQEKVDCLLRIVSIETGESEKVDGEETESIVNVLFYINISFFIF